VVAKKKKNLKIGKNLRANVDLVQNLSFSAFHPVSTPGRPQIKKYDKTDPI
jgi:hypothetical protein